MKESRFPQLFVLEPSHFGHVCIQLDLVENLVFLTYIVVVTNDLWAGRMIRAPFVVRAKGEAVKDGRTVSD